MTSRRVTVLAFSVAWVSLTAARCAWSWDGSYFFILLTNGGPPFAIFDRYTTTALMLPAWIVGQWSATAAAYVLSGVFAAVPLGCLWLCSRLLRGSPERIVWPAVGLLLTLPGQLFLMSEAGILSNLTWPMVVLAAGAPTTRRVVLGAALAVAALFVHPLAMLVFAALSLVFGLRFVGQRQRWLLHAAGVSLALASISALLPRTPYERAATSWSTLEQQFGRAVDGAPLRIVVLALVAAGAVHLHHQLVAAGCLLLLAIDGVLWASQPALWRAQLDYRAWTVPFTLVAVAGFFLTRSSTRLPAWFVPGVACAFAIVLAVQASEWHRLTQRLQDRVEHAAGCLDPIETNTALDHWSATPLSAVVQGRGEVRSAIVERANCEAFVRGRLKPAGAEAVESDRYVFNPPDR
jgi:hypothetical protein